MNPALEQIKTDESVWPEGASHYIDGVFTKWIDGDEYELNNETKEWEKEWEEISFGLDYYMNDDTYNVIPRPTKAFVPEVGEWCEHASLNKYGKLFYIGLDSSGFKAFNDTKGELLKFGDSAEFRPIKSERAELIDIIEASGNMPDGVLADNILNAGFTKEPTK